MKTYELTIGDKSYKVEVDQFNGKQAVVKVDGKPYSIAIERGGEAAPMGAPPTPTAVDAPGPEVREAPSAPQPPTGPVASVPSGGQVIAPMPGLILEVLVSVGEGVAAGTPVVKMEAMKMENEIPAPANGTVKEIRVKEGDRVQTDDVLLVIDEG